MNRFLFLILTVIGLALTACSSVRAKEPERQSAISEQAAAEQPAQNAGNQPPQLTELTDDQGAVVVSVKPLDLGGSPDTLDFAVSLSTHSVDLSMDLSVMATLSSDNGLSVQGAVWDAPLGGHHVSGTLSFPASAGGGTILEGATKLILVIKDLDAPERVFSWDLK